MTYPATPSFSKCKPLVRGHGFVVAACLLPLVAGCSFSGHFKNFEFPSFAESEFSVQPQPDAPEAPKAASKWWQEFNTPELNELVELALENNQDLGAAEAAVRAAQADLDSASTSLFPAFTLNASRNERTVKGNALSPVALSTSGYTTSAQLSAEYEIDLWSRVRSSNKAAQANLQASELDFQASQLAIAGQVSTAWVQWVATNQTINLFQQELSDYETNLKLVEFRFKQGSAPASDVLQQRQLVESTRGSLASAQSNAKLIANSLNTLTARPFYKMQTQSDDLPELPPFPDTGVPSEALQRRPDVQSAMQQIQAADQQVAAAIANRFPQLTLTASFGDQTRDSSTLFDNFTRNFALNMIAPLFDGGARAAQVDSRKAQLEQAFARYRQTTLAAIEEIENALVQEANQKDVVTSLAQQVELAEQSLARLFAGYRNGSVSYLNILNAQQSASSLKRSLVNAKQQLLVFRISLYRALSGGLNPPLEANS